MKKTAEIHPLRAAGTRTIGLTLAGAAFVLAAAVAGCGSSSDDSVGGAPAPAPSPAGPTITIQNQLGQQVTVYMGFNGNTLGCYSASDFPFCSFNTGNPVVCTFPVGAQSSQVVTFDKNCKVSPAFSVNSIVWGDCPVTMAEFTLADNGTDTYDISLVNNLNVGMSIVPTSGTTIGPVTSPTGNQTAVGVYPQLCTTCDGNGGAPTWPGCPTPDASQCKTNVAMYPCQLSQPSGASYTVTIQ